MNSSRLVPTILGYESLNPETISLLDTQTYWYLLECIARTPAYSCDIEGWLDHLRLLVKHGSGLTLAQNADLLDHYDSPLAAYVGTAACRRSHSWDRFEREAQSACKSWLQLLANAGLDLALYGKCESRLLAANGFQVVWQQDESHPAIRPCRAILGLSYGPTVSDWHLWLDCPYDQWAADFWYMLEQDSTVSVPGAWVDEDEERGIRLRSIPGRFNSLATSRRKRKRYLKVMQMSNDDARVRLGPLWETLAHINGKMREDWGRGHNWRNWPPLVADVEHMNSGEWHHTVYPKVYCSVCRGWKPLLEYYDCGRHIVEGIRTGKCHRGDNDLVKTKH